MIRWPTALLLCLAPAAQGAPDSPPETALADYVAEPDASFDWRLEQRFDAPGALVLRLILTSQTWREIDWKHQLFLIRPERLDPASGQGLLVINGGRWRERYETERDETLPDESELFIELANRLGTVVAVLGQVPFQPIFDRTEDRLIAYTFERYLATGDAEWPLLLPMVKSAVRAMDATEAAAAEEWDIELDRFIVLGGSKRGWTTWLTGVVEPRAAVLAPLVIDALNFAAHFPHQSESWGAPSAELEPYVEGGLLDVLATPPGANLRRIVDPYSYREHMTQPKLVVVATNDAYFPLDSMSLYWNELPAPKYAVYLPNQGHDVEEFDRLLAGVAALHRSSVGQDAMAELSWEYEQRGEILRLCVTAAPAPALVAAWVADSPDRDFRDAEFNPAPTRARDGVFIYDLAPPDAGFRAVYAESLFGEGEDRYVLATNPRIVDAAGRPASERTAIVGTPGVCPG